MSGDGGGAGGGGGDGGGYDAGLSFNFFQPTRIVFGDGACKDAGLECKRLGMERAVLVTDAALRKNTDVVERVAAALGARLAGIFDGAEADAPADVIDRAGAFAREHGGDGVVSVGGGSAIDTGKGVALLLTLGGGIRDHQGSQRIGRKLVPHLAVPTTAGTGAEVTQFAVVSDPVAREKMHFADDRLVPDAAVLDPALTIGMPAWLTAATALDALTHAIEAVQSIARNPLCDGLALHAIRLVAQHLPRAVLDGGDRVARGALLCAANLAGQSFNSSGVGLVHAMAHVVGARHHVHHGTANAICLPHVMRFNADELGERLVLVAEALGLPAVDARGRRLVDDPAAAAEAAAVEVARLVAAVGLPTRLRDAGVPEDDLPACAAGALSDGAIVYNGKFAADEALVLEVYRAAW